MAFKLSQRRRYKGLIAWGGWCRILIALVFSRFILG